jgi:hypothetical protein
MTWFRDKGVEPYASSEAHLRDELHRANGLVRAQLARFRLASPEPQRERFWHLPDDHLEALVHDEIASPLGTFEPPPEVQDLLAWVAERRAAIDRRVEATRDLDLRLLRLAREHGLAPAAVDALLVAWLPALHSTYRRWFGILQHDAARPLATVGLLAETLATSAAGFAELLALLAPDGPLAEARLVALGGQEDDPLPLRTATVEDRVAAFLLGSDAIDARLAPAVRWFDEPIALVDLPLAQEVANRLEMLPNLRAAEPGFLPRLRLVFSGPDPQLAVRAFATVASALQRPLLVVDVPAALASGAPWSLTVDGALREARLGGGLPIFAGAGALSDGPEQAHRLGLLLRRLDAFPHPAAVETGGPPGEAGRSPGGWIPFRLAAPSVAQREALWARRLADGAQRLAGAEGLARDLAGAFQLTDEQIREAWRAAEGLARRRNVFLGAVEPDDLFQACRQLSATRLVAFAERVEPGRLTLERDVVLPAASKQALLELRSRIRHHARVHAAMGLGEHMQLGRGVTALFVGGSGAGKSFTARVLASEQQIDLYRIDLSALVSKWVGDTEKNLSRIFADAERANCMLFFDEADAVFGRRGEVKEARDRWANLEVNYLLQRIEEYSGVVVLATNLRQNIDDAFQRRLHVVVEFPMPDARSRRAIWDRLLPPEAHRAVPPADLDELAQRFALTGGNIRNVVLDACYRALDVEQAAVTTRHLVASAAREYQKSSRPVTRGDFGRFYEWAIEDVVAPAAAHARATGA